MKPSRPPQRKTELRSNPEKFIQRGRESSARALRESGRKAARKNGSRPRAISPASPEQRAAVEGMACLGCGRHGSEWLAIDAAHLWPRGRGGCDHPRCVTPLCRAFDGTGCHRDFDEGRLDLLKVVNAAFDQWREQVQHALEHCNPVELVERLAGARTQWSDVA